MISSGGWIPIKEACVISDVSIGWIRYGISQGDIPSKKVGGMIFVPRKYFEQMNEFILFCDSKREWGNDLDCPWYEFEEA